MFQVPDGRLKRAGPVVDRLRMSHTPGFKFAVRSLPFSVASDLERAS